VIASTVYWLLSGPVLKIKTKVDDALSTLIVLSKKQENQCLC